MYIQSLLFVDLCFYQVSRFRLVLTFLTTERRPAHIVSTPLEIWIWHLLLGEHISHHTSETSVFNTWLEIPWLSWEWTILTQSFSPCHCIPQLCTVDWWPSISGRLSGFIEAYDQCNIVSDGHAFIMVIVNHKVLHLIEH